MCSNTFSSPSQHNPPFWQKCKLEQAEHWYTQVCYKFSSLRHSYSQYSTTCLKTDEQRKSYDHLGKFVSLDIDPSLAKLAVEARRYEATLGGAGQISCTRYNSELDALHGWSPRQISTVNFRCFKTWPLGAHPYGSIILCYLDVPGVLFWGWWSLDVTQWGKDWDSKGKWQAFLEPVEKNLRREHVFHQTSCKDHDQWRVSDGEERARAVFSTSWLEQERTLV